MIPYLIFIGCALAGGPLLAKQPEYRRKFLLAFALACWLLASLRYVTGFDYRSYETAFQNITAGGLSSLTVSGKIEPGYILLNLVTDFLGGGYRALDRKSVV